MCVLDYADIYDLATGEVLPLPEGIEYGVALYRTELRLQGDRWLVDGSFSRGWFGLDSRDECTAALP